MSRKSHAVTEPSATRPARTSITAIGRRKPHWNSSARLQCTCTGRPAPRAVLAAEPDARGRDDPPDRGLAYPERFAEPGADRERDVGARPDGQPAAVPLRSGRPGLWPAARI